jgi:hypothetical protein
MSARFFWCHLEITLVLLVGDIANIVYIIRPLQAGRRYKQPLKTG